MVGEAVVKLRKDGRRDRIRKIVRDAFPGLQEMCPECHYPINDEGEHLMGSEHLMEDQITC